MEEEGKGRKREVSFVYIPSSKRPYAFTTEQ